MKKKINQGFPISLMGSRDYSARPDLIFVFMPLSYSPTPFTSAALRDSSSPKESQQCAQFQGVLFTHTTAWMVWCESCATWGSPARGMLGLLGSLIQARDKVSKLATACNELWKMDKATFFERSMMNVIV